MSFTPHNISDAKWANFVRISEDDAQYPAITARITDNREFAGSAVVTDDVQNRFGRLVLGDTKKFASTSTNTASSVSTTSVKLLSASTGRKGLKLYNHEGGSPLYIHEGAQTAASVSNATAVVAPGEIYSAKPPVWTGEVYGITTDGTAQIAITDYTLAPSSSATDAGFSFETCTYQLISNTTDGNNVVNKGDWDAKIFGISPTTLASGGELILSGEFMGGRPTASSDVFTIKIHAASGTNVSNVTFWPSQQGNPGYDFASMSWDTRVWTTLTVRITGAEIGDYIQLWASMHGSQWVDSYPTLYWRNVEIKICPEPVPTTTTTSTSTTTTSTSTTSTSTTSTSTTSTSTTSTSTTSTSTTSTSTSTTSTSTTTTSSVSDVCVDGGGYEAVDRTWSPDGTWNDRPSYDNNYLSYPLYMFFNSTYNTWDISSIAGDDDRNGLWYNSAVTSANTPDGADWTGAGITVDNGACT